MLFVNMVLSVAVIYEMYLLVTLAQGYFSLLYDEAL